MRDPDIKWIEHKGKQILFNNRKNFTEEEIMASVEAVVDLIRSSGKTEILYLLDITNNFVVSTVKDRMKQASKEIEPYIKKIAVIGVVGAQKILVNILNKMIKYRINIFDTHDEAKDWLVKD